MKTQTKILIFLASALLFGYTYAFDIPQALEAPLRLAPYHYNNFEFNLLYFFQFLPVALLQIPLGVVIDKYPVKKSLSLFAGLSLASVIVAGLAFQFLFTGYKWVIDGSRSVFGMCGEAQFTVQAVVLAHFAKEDY
jgi:MFS family permease